MPSYPKNCDVVGERNLSRTSDTVLKYSEERIINIHVGVMHMHLASNFV